MHVIAKRAAIILLLGLFLSVAAGAQEPTSPGPYSGDLWTRSTLSGDWSGARNTLAVKGIIIDMSLTQAAQGIVHGGKNTGWQYGGGRGNITINLDSQKLGLWSGGLLTAQAEGNFIPDDSLRKSINGRSGALMPVNSSQFYPMPAGDNFNLPQLSFTQSIGAHAALLIGKLDTTSGDANEFAHGKGDMQFMNLAFNFNPVPLMTTPYSTLGTGLSLFPTGNPQQAIINFLVLQANGQASRSGFDDLDANKMTFAVESRVRTNFFARTGHQLLGATFSNRNFNAIDQNARFVFEHGAFEEKKGSWNVYYNFDQYLYEPKKGSGEGIGVFARFGASDGNPNFMHFFYSLGFGGRGVIPQRENDRYGLGVYYIDVDNPEFQGLFRTTKLLRDEYGFEAFYNIAITPWLQLTPDLQVVRGAQKNKIKLGRSPLGIPFIASKRSIGTATILGLRLKMIF